MIITVKWLGDGKSMDTAFMLDIPKGKELVRFIGSDKPKLNGKVKVEVK